MVYIVKKMLIWDAGSIYYYQGHQGLWINFRKLKITRIIWKICLWMHIYNASHLSAPPPLLRYYKCMLLFFLYISIFLNNITRVSHSHFIDEDIKSKWHIIWTRFWVWGPSFLDSSSLFILLQWTRFQNHRTWFLLESIL